MTEYQSMSLLSEECSCSTVLTTVLSSDQPSNIFRQTHTGSTLATTPYTAMYAVQGPESSTQLGGSSFRKWLQAHSLTKFTTLRKREATTRMAALNCCVLFVLRDICRCLAACLQKHMNRMLMALVHSSVVPDVILFEASTLLSTNITPPIPQVTIYKPAKMQRTTLAQRSLRSISLSSSACSSSIPPSEITALQYIQATAMYIRSSRATQSSTSRLKARTAGFQAGMGEGSSLTPKQMTMATTSEQMYTSTKAMIPQCTSRLRFLCASSELSLLIWPDFKNLLAATARKSAQIAMKTNSAIASDTLRQSRLTQRGSQQSFSSYIQRFIIARNQLATYLSRNDGLPPFPEWTAAN